DLSKLSPSAVVTGIADGSGGANTLELAAAAGTGTIAGIGASFTNFGTVAVDSGAQWVFAGANTIAGGARLSDVGTATVTGTLTNAGSIAVGGALILSGNSAGRAVLLDSGPLSGTVRFAAGDANYATLKIAGTANLPGIIAGFTGAHDLVDLTQLSDAGNDATAILDASSNILTVTGDNGAVQLQLEAEDYTGIKWVVTSDGGGGSNVFATRPAPTVTEALVSDTGVS